MGYWKAKVLPKIKKVLDITSPKKPAAAAAAQSCKTFDASKEEMNRACEEKREELQPKVLEIYEASSVEIKSVVKKPTKKVVNKHSAPVTKFLELLSKIDFPGAKQALDDSTEHGVALVSTSVFFVFEKVAGFLPAEPAKPEAAAAEVAVAEETRCKEASSEIVEENKEAAAVEGPSGTTDGAKEAAAEPPKAEDPPLPKV